MFPFFQFSASEYNELWERDAAWLEQAIAAEASGRQRPIAVLTHHVPTFDGSSHPSHGRPDLDGRSINLVGHAFSTDMESMFGGSVKLWCYGHTHFNNDHYVGGTRLVSNQLGYPQKWVEHYDPRFVIEMEAWSIQESPESPEGHEAIASEYKPPVCNPYGVDHAAG